MQRLKLVILLFVVQLLTVQSQTFTSNPGSAIPDDGSQNCHTLNVTGVGNMNASYGITNICIDISHTWAADLDIYLVSPTGLTIELTTDNGSSRDDYSVTCFDHNAGTPITSGSAPFNGTYAPEGNLSSLNSGITGDGDWQLCITDDSNRNSGTLNSWSITFGSNPPAPPAPTEQDCNGAIPVCQTTYTQNNSYSGVGNIPDEIDPGPSCLNSGERNDVWYIFTVQSSGNLNFSITPNTGTDDYDWAVFDITTSNCSDIATNPALEVSCNWSANAGNGGITGPNNGSTAQDEPAFAVNQGETYVVNISNYSSSQSGYFLDFGASTAQIFDVTPPEIQSVATPIACGATAITFDFNENILCNTVDDADFILTGPGGPYTLSNISGSTCSAGGSFENTFTADVTPAITTSGSFTLTLDASAAGSVTDNCGNVAPSGSLNFDIVGVTASITSSTNSSCNALDDGSAQASGANGTAPYTYLWDDPAAQTTATATNLAPGTYTVTVTDNNGCSGTNSVTLTEPDPIVIAISSSDETCPAAADGNATASISSGGTAPFSYSWNSTPAQATATANNLVAGTYEVTVTDNNGCSETGDVTINTGTAVTSDPTATANACFTGHSFTFSNNGSTGAGINYSWDFGDGSGTSVASNPSYSYSAPGSYTVELTIDNGACSDVNTIDVEVYPELSLSATTTDVTCNGDCDGSIDLTVSGGTAPFTYTWDNGAGAGEDPTGLCANIYQVTVSDVYGCTANLTESISEPAALSTSTSFTDVTCNGNTDGTATVTPSNGTAPYTYSWDDGASQSTSTATNLVSGTYNVTVTDNNNCSVVASITISEPNALTLSVTETDLSCFGDTDGALDLTVTNGTAPYTYSWSNSETTEDLTNLSSGTYTVTVTDNNGCTENTSGTVDEPNDLTLTLNPTNLTCNAAGNGNIATGVMGGTAPYTYAWDDALSQTTSTASNLDAGAYNVTVTDNNGCTETASATLTEPTAITVSLTTGEPSCNGVCDGSANATASGGTGTLTYAWDNGAGATANVNTLCGGTTYTVTVTDDNGCTATDNFTPTDPTALSLNTTGNDASCNGNPDGDATVAAAGGDGSFTYSWDDGALQTTATANNLGAGTYTVTVTDGNGCSETDTYTVNEPAAITLTTSSNPSTCGNANGDATVVAAGGAGGFLYAWDDPGTQTTATATGLSSGAYTVTVTDGNGCTETATVNINDVGGLTASIDASTNVDCNGNNTGTATASGSGGTLPYTFQWNDAANQITATANGLAAGTYSVTITDFGGCTASETVTITEPAALVANISASSNVSCNGGNTGSATVTVSGGSTPYVYAWNDAATQSTATATNLIAGNYTVNITDNNGCLTTNNVNITEPDAIVITEAITNVNCFGQATGEIDLTVSGGAAPLTYSWNTGTSVPDLTNLLAGNYDVTVTDNNGCTETGNYTVTENTEIDITLTANHPTCDGNTDGSITSVIAGGIAPYTYAWDDAGTQSTADATNLGAGTFTITVTDNLGCTNTASETLSAPAALTATISGVDANCGQNDGSASVVVAGGTAPYTYTWDDALGQSASTATNLLAGSYSVDITDNNGCTLTSNITINNNGGGTANISAVINETCAGSCDGSITATVVGGTAPFTYAWNDAASQSTATASNLCSGNYEVTITDATGCSSTANATISSDPAIIITPTAVSEISCNGGNDGYIDITISGGTSPYTFDWNGVYTSEDISGLTAGNYNVTVTDNNGCTANFDTTLIEPSLINISQDNIQNLTCFNANDGAINLTVSGGTAPLTFTWNDPSNQSTEDASSLSAGSYEITVTDANSCSSSATYNITSPTELTLTTSKTDPSCGASNGDANVVAAGGTGPYTYNWDDPGSSISDNVTNIPQGNYSVVVEDANGCQKSANVTLTDLSGPTVSILSQTDVSCNTLCDGIVTVNATGGSAPYTFAWNDPVTQNTATASGLCAGNYEVEVTDNAGCTATLAVTINEPNTISINLNSAGVSCNGACDGEITSIVSGGTLPYSYTWNDPSNQTTPTATGLCPGNYLLNVQDANGCSVSAAFDVTEPDFTLSSTSTSSTCGNNDGSATVNVDAGTGPYTYLWNDASNQNTATAISLVAGTYTVIVTDANNCTKSLDVTVSDTGGPNITVDSSSDPLCFNGNDGVINTTISGGTTPYNISWDDPANQTTGDATGLSAGTYSITVLDANNCSVSETVTLTNPNDITIALTSTSDVSCYGVCDGNAIINVTNGTIPYSYSWNDPGNQTSSLATGLCAGNYTVTVTDANSCQKSLDINIGTPDTLEVSITETDILCNGVCNGSIEATTSGGTLPYSFAWNDPANQTAQTASGLCAGNYSVTVTDANGCNNTINGTITEPSALTITANTLQDESCANVSDGVISVDVSGGSAPYTYAWDDPSNSTGSTINNLAPGSYTVSVTDNQGCVSSAVFTIGSGGSLTASITPTNPTCFGQNNGSASVNVTGGTAPLTYQWNDIALQTTSTASNLDAGSFTVNITDANGCSTSSNTTLTQPSQITLTTSTTTSTCGNPDGSASVTVGGGVGPFSYLWNDASNQTTATANSLIAGSYQVIVTDGNACQDSAQINIVDGAGPVIAISSFSDADCFNEASGSATVQVNGGQSPYTISWNDAANQTDVTAINLLAGTYSATVTDANGCTATTNVTIDEPTELVASISSTNDLSCYAACDGSATAIANGGTSPYTFAWNDGSNQSTATASNLCAGSYDVIVSDANGCSVTRSTTVNQPDELSLTLTSQNTSCNLSTGSALVQVNNGNAPYVFSWDDAANQQTANANNLAEGWVRVTVTDNEGCSKLDSTFITNISDEVVSVTSITHETCFEAEDAEIQTSVTGMVSPLTYSWNDASNQTTAIATGLAPGNYTLTVNDAIGCQVQVDTTIIAASEIILSANITDPSCYNLSDGAIDLSVSGGSGNYSYSWDNATFSSTEDISGIDWGDYTVTVEDDNNCIVNDTYTLTNPAQITVSSTASNANCGNSDGSITATATNGSAPYSYLWDDSFGQTSATATGLSAGTYIVIATDQIGCIGSDTVQVQDADGVVVSIDQITNVSCFGGSDGQLIANSVGGDGPYSYAWNDALNQNTSSAVNLSVGTYEVTVTDDNGCTSSAVASISQPSELDVSITSTPPLCDNSCDATATANAINGTGPYIYQWNDAQNQTGSTASALCEGIYTVVITDANACTVSGIVDIQDPTAVTGNITTTLTSCVGSCDGTAQVTAGGGTGYYTYAWQDPANQTGTSALDLCAGSISVIITDGNNCSTTISASVSEPPLLTASISNATMVSCFGLCDGYAQVNPNGGTSPYTYLWNDVYAQTSQGANNLCEGIYQVRVTDANGCQTNSNIQITQPQELSLATSSRNTTCYDGCDGQAIAQASGGSGSYAYLWNDIALQSTATAINLCDGTYEVRVTDQNNCQQTASVTVQEPTEIQVTTTNTPSNCGNNNGTATASAIGGTAPYSFQWNDLNRQITSTATSLFAGSYRVTVSDAFGCQKREIVNINDIEAPTLSLVNFQDVTCYNQNDASIEINISGGVTPYNILWNDGNSQSSSAAIGLIAGTYTATVTDNAGCISSITQVIAQPSELVSAVVQRNNPSCFGSCDGDISTIIAGGTAPYTYSWNDANSQITKDAVDLCDGNYNLTITDQNGCQSVLSTSLSEPTQLSLNGTTQDITCFGFQDGRIEATASGGTPGYYYNWVPSGRTGATATNLSTGTHTLTVRDQNNCSYSESWTLGEPTSLSVSTTTFATTCSEDNGSAVVNASGGTTPYTYNWSPTVNGTNQVSFLSPGTYFLNLVDANGCSELRELTIFEIPAPYIERFDVINSICNDSDDGQIEVIVKHVEEPALYNWSPFGGSTTLASPLSPGIYNISITDANGCEVFGSATVGEPDPVDILTDGNGLFCFGEEFRVTASAFGGNGDYSYSWTPAGIGDTNIFSDTASSSITYSVFATDHLGCTSPTGNIEVNVRPPLDVTITSESEICLEDSTSIVAEAFDGNGGPYYYTWLGTIPDNDSIMVDPIADTWYYLSVTDSCSLPVEDSVQIQVNPLPTAIIVPDTIAGCQPLEINFDYFTDIATSFEWTFGNGDSSDLNNPITNYPDTGAYTVSLTAITDEGCQTTVIDTNLISVKPKPNAGFVSKPKQTTTVAPKIFFEDQSQGAVSVWWDFGNPSADELNSSSDNNPNHSFENAGEYVVTQYVESEFACLDTIQDTVTVMDGFIIFFPDVFTPNGDNQNDTWKPLGTGIENEGYQLSIYSRWGQLLFESSDHEQAWDGTYLTTDKQVPVGVYIWRLVLLDENGDERLQHGDVTIVR